MLNTFSFLLNLDFDHFSQDNFYVLGAGFGIHVFLLYIILSFFLSPSLFAKVWVCYAWRDDFSLACVFVWII